jgi:integrase
MPSLTITTRRTTSGPRYVVRYRLGGRAYPVEHAGSFKTLREAKARRDLIGGELANGRNPRLLLDAMRTPTVASHRTVAQWGEAMVASRVDVSDNRIRFLNTALRVRINPVFGERAPGSIVAPEVQEWVAALAAELAPRSVLNYWQVLAQVLDYAEIDPNPARHKTVKLPYADVEEATPPSAEHFLAIVERLSPRLRLPTVFLEQTAARVSELRVWEWQDVDVQGSRIRSRGVKGRRGTRRVLWRQVPPWLMEVLLQAVPPDDRTAERKLFPGLSEGTMRDAIGRASRAAGLPLYSPHDLRHRRGSLWHASGMPGRELAERMGHSKPSMSIDVYTHVMPPEEIDLDFARALLVTDVLAATGS